MSSRPASSAGLAPAAARLRRDMVRARAVLAADVTELIGNTPLVRLGRLERDTAGVELWAKAEFANPGGSVKDRAALRIIRDALGRGDLGPGVTLIDSTSGNTGIAYSMVGAALGVDVALVMPGNVSEPRKQITRSYGTQLMFSDPMEGSDGAILECHRIVEADPGRYYYPDQYGNESNWRAHYDGTGAELWQQTNGRITHFVTGIGTSGTIMGVSRKLHELGRVHCIGMQPDDAFHGLEGLKHVPSSIVPAIYDESALDDVLWMSTEDGWDMADRLAREEGLFVGHSSGANVAAAYRVARSLSERGEPGVVATVLCDRSDRYFAPLQWDRYHAW